MWSTLSSFVGLIASDLAFAAHATFQFNLCISLCAVTCSRLNGKPLLLTGDLRNFFFFLQHISTSKLHLITYCKGRSKAKESHSLFEQFAFFPTSFQRSTIFSQRGDLHARIPSNTIDTSAIFSFKRLHFNTESPRRQRVDVSQLHHSRMRTANVGWETASGLDVCSPPHTHAKKLLIQGSQEPKTHAAFLDSWWYFHIFSPS